MATEEIKANWESEKFKKYRAVHRWLQYNYGTPSICENPNCDVKNIKRYEWALKPNLEYDYKRSNYIRLCCVCHKRMDYKLNYIKGSRSSSKAPKIRRAVKLTAHNGDVSSYNSINQAAYILNISDTSISNACKGFIKNSRLGKWEYN